MGKGEGLQPLPSTTLDGQGTNPSGGNSNGCCLGCRRIKKLVTFRCVFVLILGVGVLLSAVFWLPFLHLADQKDLDLDYAGHDIVASFMLKRPVSFLNDYILQLEGDIFDEMRFSSTKVEIISLESSAGSNITKVVFAVESDVTAQSLIREYFLYLITHQYILHLTENLFGVPSSFEVLKFRGGIAVSPDQRAFLMQNVQIRFNFTLNFSIDQLLNNFGELTSQLKTGLHLAPYENLYIRLTNLRGSTVAPPTTVQAQVFLAVGSKPSKSRFKQLARTITGSHAKNLGLNHTVFGRVKQVSLSSVLQHSPGGDGSSPSPSPSLSPSPLPSPSLSPSPMSKPHNHRSHHHHHAGLSPSVSPSPSMGRSGSVTGKQSPMSAPVPAPLPGKNKAAESPACHFGYNNKFPRKHNKQPQTAPSAPPVYAPDAAPSQAKQVDPPTPTISPIPAENPHLNVPYAHSQPPPQGEYHRARPPNAMPLISPSPSPSSAGILYSNTWTLLLFIVLGLHL